MSQIDQIRKFIADSIETMDNDKFADPHDVRIKKQVLDGLLREIDTLQEQPVCEGLDEAAGKSAIITYKMPEDGDFEKANKTLEARVFHEIGFKAGAKWQKEQMNPTCEDVSREEVIGLSIMAYLETHIKKDKGLVLRGVTLHDAREWIRRQIAKLPSSNDVICSQYHPNWKDNQEQHTCDELEEEIERYLHSLGVGYGGWVDGMEDDDLRGIARHFAQWGAEHARGSSEIPNDLEEAAVKFADREYMVGDVDRSALYKGFWHGAKWQMEQGRTFETEFDGYNSIELTLDKYVLQGLGIYSHNRVIIQVRKKES